jgi:hypothetical protein
VIPFQKHFEKGLTDQSQATSSRLVGPERRQQLEFEHKRFTVNYIQKQRKGANQVWSGEDSGKYPYDPNLERSVNERGEPHENDFHLETHYVKGHPGLAGGAGYRKEVGEFAKTREEWLNVHRDDNVQTLDRNIYVLRENRTNARLNLNDDLKAKIMIEITWNEQRKAELQGGAGNS